MRLRLRVKEKATKETVWSKRASDVIFGVVVDQPHYPSIVRGVYFLLSCVFSFLLFCFWIFPASGIIFGVFATCSIGFVTTSSL